MRAINQVIDKGLQTLSRVHFLGYSKNYETLLQIQKDINDYFNCRGDISALERYREDSSED